MHPYKDKAKTGRELAKQRGYSDGGGVDDIIGSGAGLLKMAVEPFGLIKAVGKAFRGDEDNNAANFVPKAEPKKRGGKVMKKGC